MIISSAGKSDIGLVRKANEDFIKIWDDKLLYIVCDGMGGHNAGEVASKTACELVAGLYGGHFDRLLTDDRLKLPRMLPQSTDVLTKATRIANHWIYHKASSNPELSGMGTTITAVAIEEDILTALHVGDSRIYRYYDGELLPLTIDHSWAAELEHSEKITAEEASQLVNRNVITRALGVKESVDIDVAIRRVIDGDMYILMSDGLCGYVSDGDIRRVVTSASGDVEQVVELLVQLANDRGGSDNVSVVALRIDGKVDHSQHSEMDVITIDAEPPEYYEAEEEWAEKAENPLPRPVADTRKKSGPGLGGIFAFVIALGVIATIFYYILKG